MSRTKAAAIVLIALLQVASCETLGALPAAGRRARAPPRAGTIETTQSWYHADQGTAFFPYAWLLALEQAEGRERFTAPGNMERFGFLSNPPHPTFNPDGLPVGFSRTSLDLERPPFSCWPGEWVGLTCAACHTGEIRYHGERIRIEGGPAQNDIEGFRISLAAGAGRDLDRPRQGAALRRPGCRPRPAIRRSTCRPACAASPEAGAARERVIEREGLAAADEPPTDSGFGRLDALGRGGNFLFAESTGIPANYEPTTAPVSFPPLWDTPYLDWVLYNNSVRQPLARSIVEALGVGAPIDLRTLNEPVLQHQRPARQRGRPAALAAGAEVAALAGGDPRPDRPPAGRRGARRSIAASAANATS